MRRLVVLLLEQRVAQVEAGGRGERRGRIAAEVAVERGRLVELAVLVEAVGQVERAPRGRRGARCSLPRSPAATRGDPPSRRRGDPLRSPLRGRSRTSSMSLARRARGERRRRRRSGAGAGRRRRCRPGSAREPKTRNPSGGGGPQKAASSGAACPPRRDGSGRARARLKAASPKAQRPLVALLATVGVLAGQGLLLHALDGRGQRDQARIGGGEAEVSPAGAAGDGLEGRLVQVRHHDLAGLVLLEPHRAPVGVELGHRLALLGAHAHRVHHDSRLAGLPHRGRRSRPRGPRRPTRAPSPCCGAPCPRTSRARGRGPGPASCPARARSRARLLSRKRPSASASRVRGTSG